MADDKQAKQRATLVGSDIVFECVHCGKSLEIGVQGAGLKIQCPECNEDIIVPIPEGVELSDIDQSFVGSSVSSDGGSPAAPPDQQDYESIVEADALLGELEELRFRTQHLERLTVQYREAAERLLEQADTIRLALKEIDETLSTLVEKSSDETQQLG